LPNEFGDLIADPPHLFFQTGGIFSLAPRSADFLAQAFAIRVALLQSGLHFSPLGVDPEHLLDLRLVAAAAGRQPAFHEVGIFAEQTNVEHVAGVISPPPVPQPKALRKRVTSRGALA
jgi:hypothetical protein